MRSIDVLEAYGGPTQPPEHFHSMTVPERTHKEHWALFWWLMVAQHHHSMTVPEGTQEEHLMFCVLILSQHNHQNTITLWQFQTELIRSIEDVLMALGGPIQATFCNSTEAQNMSTWMLAKSWECLNNLAWTNPILIDVHHQIWTSSEWVSASANIVLPWWFPCSDSDFTARDQRSDFWDERRFSHLISTCLVFCWTWRHVKQFNVERWYRGTREKKFFFVCRISFIQDFNHCRISTLSKSTRAKAQVKRVKAQQFLKKEPSLVLALLYRAAHVQS